MAIRQMTPIGTGWRIAELEAALALDAKDVRTCAHARSTSALSCGLTEAGGP